MNLLRNQAQATQRYTLESLVRTLMPFAFCVVDVWLMPPAQNERNISHAEHHETFLNICQYFFWELVLFH
jgi:hypothetical protein